MQGVTPYLSFNGNCAEAMEFYRECLGGEMLFAQTFGDSPMKGAAPDDQIMHCTLRVGDTHIMASDNPAEHQASFGDNISLAIGTADPAEAEEMFSRMAEGGTVTMPMQETFWAERFGMLRDKYGVNWMFNCEKPHDQMQA